jgi:hypothetical protein
VGAKAKQAEAPLLAAQVFTTRCWSFSVENQYGCVDHHLAVQTAAGWFVAGYRGSECTNHRGGGSLKVKELAVKRLVPGGAPQVTLRMHEETEWSGGGTMSEGKSEHLVVASAGASGKPSATPAIPVWEETSEEPFAEEEGQETKSSSSQFRLKIDFLPDGQIEIGEASGKLDKARRGALLGKHTLVFP